MCGIYGSASSVASCFLRFVKDKEVLHCTVGFMPFSVAHWRCTVDVIEEPIRKSYWPWGEIVMYYHYIYFVIKLRDAVTCISLLPHTAHKITFMQACLKQTQTQLAQDHGSHLDDRIHHSILVLVDASDLPHYMI